MPNSWRKICYGGLYGGNFGCAGLIRSSVRQLRATHHPMIGVVV
ncbi:MULTISPECIES: hypothetical protein [Acinetobacter calcoaceticus/baumannii complex]|nr:MULTISPECIES: hypothetical protein [Acinetobacter calcoaceticus/baumannii complex]MCZ3283654.1 hypothetical protein [Acinetobacter baumannii]MDC5224846.1 hypothetical protein [Acinetobacter baumannii]MDP7914065.1 hypothetical protein [Acinetobacter baumannii]